MWIEISKVVTDNEDEAVTSLAEVWIEICIVILDFTPSAVTSLAEVWIEISAILSKYGSKAGHFPCGSVD